MFSHVEMQVCKRLRHKTQTAYMLCYFWQLLSSKGGFPALVFVTKLCQLLIFSTSWEQCTCTNIGHLAVS